MYSRGSLFHSVLKETRWKSWNVTNNKRNLLPPLLHGRAPEGGNVNDIPRDEVDLEREREREFFKVVENLPWKSRKVKGKNFFFVRRTRENAISKIIHKTITDKHAKCTRNVLLLERSFVNMMHHFVRFESDTIKWISGRWTFARRKRTFVNENPPPPENPVTMKPGRDYTVFIRWSKISREPIPGYIDLIKLRDLQTVNYTRGGRPESGIIQGILVANATFTTRPVSI